MKDLGIGCGKEAKKVTINITYFAHGTTLDNENEISSGWSDVELSELGISQSIELSHQISGGKFDLVFCSDLKRSMDSARLTFEKIVPVIVDQRLRECNFGEFNARPSSIVEPMQVKAIKERFPGGESYEDVEVRINDFLNFLRELHGGKSVGLVAHRASQFALEVLLNKKTWEEAFADDWRKSGVWKPGWEYVLE
jgi:alpha-ribazole phosphatase/probable phosphoglycerate mutase